MPRRRDNSLSLIALSVVILAVATVLDRVLGIVYAQHTGNKLVIAVAILTAVLGLTALVISLATKTKVR